MRYKRVVVVGILLLLIAALAYHFLIHPTHRAKKTASIPPTLVKVMTTHAQTVPVTVQTTGVLSARYSTNISAKVSGYIKKIDYSEGQRVSANQVLITLSQRQQATQVQLDQIAAALSGHQYLRDQTLLKHGLITQDSYYTAKVNHQQAHAKLVQDQIDLADRTIYAPFAGVVGEQTVNVGDFITAGQTLTTLVDPTHLQLTYTLPSRYLSQLHLGQTVSITPNDSSPLSEKATLHYISDTVDQATQTVTIHADLTTHAAAFKPGVYVNVQQVLGEEKNKITVPQTSVIPDLDGYYLFVIKPGKTTTVHKQKVTLGPRLDRDVVIEHGLTPGERVVIVGQDELRDGSSVKIITPTAKHA